MKKSRKKYPSDEKTTVRISHEIHAKIIKAAKDDGRTIEKFVEMTFSAALSPKI